MCPISGSLQFLIVIVTLLLLCHMTLVKTLKITFESKNVTVNMYDTMNINYTLEDLGQPPWEGTFQIYSDDNNIASTQLVEINLPNDPPLTGSFNLTANFLGNTKIFCRPKGSSKSIDGSLDVIVIRKARTIDTVFTASVATLVSIIYINFGCVLNWGELKKNLKRPIGPAIGFVGQFLLMPVLSFILGKVLFPDNHEMQLGMFFTGISPAGGASNIWAVILGANVDLSVTMTTISTIAAFGMMPLWVFTLGKLIFDKAKLGVPYEHIASLALGLIIPLLVGFLLTRYMKKVAQFLARILKGLSSLLILFIIVFAIITNLYLFQLFSWQIVVAGMGLPYIGFVLAYILAKVLRQPEPDCLAISIETGIQNTGIAIFLLRFALPQPAADLTTVAPVAVAIMTPFPLLILFIYKKISDRISSQNHKKLSDNISVFGNDTDNNLNNIPKNDQLGSSITVP